MNKQDLKNYNDLITDVLQNDINITISYSEFKKVIIIIFTYYIQIITEFKENIIFEVTDNLPKNTKGRTIGLKRVIIDNSIIEKIYNGNRLEFVTIFHELCHIKQNYEMIYGKINKDIIKMIKDTLIRKEVIGNANKKATYDCYYEDNYEVDSREVLANIDSYIYLLDYFKHINVFLTKEEQGQILKNIKQAQSNYENSKRDLTRCDKFNDLSLNLDDVFDSSIKFHPEWLKEYKQLKIEYYIDNEDQVQKRSIDELESIAFCTPNEDIKKYLNNLIYNKQEKITEKVK